MTARVHRRGGRAANAVGGLIAAIALFAAAPAGLVWAAQQRFGSANPLAGARLPWTWTRDEVGDSVSRPIEDDTVVDLVIRLGIVVAWVAVAILAITTVLEIVHQARHRGLPSPRRRGLRWAQPVARFVAAGLVAVLPLASTAPTPIEPLATAVGHLDHPDQLSLPATPSVPPGSRGQRLVVDDPSGAVATTTEARWAQDTGAVRRRAEPRADERVHVVARGESVWSIAERLAAETGAAGEASTMRIAQTILDRNLGATMNDGATFDTPALIHPGWELLVPGGPGASSGAAPTGHDGGPETAVETGVVTVEAGDTLWDLADDEFGDPTQWQAIADANLGRTMADGRVFSDPDLIVPGWDLLLRTPDTGAATDDTTPDDEVATDDAAELDDVDWFDLGDDVDDDSELGAFADESPTSVPDRPSVTAGPSTTPPSATATPATTGTPAASTPTITTTTTPSTTAPAAQPSTTAPTAPAAATGTSTTPPSTGAATPPPGGDGVADPPAAPAAPTTPLGLEHAAMLAGGLLTVAAVRRRRRLRAAQRTARRPDLPPSVVRTERLLRSISAAERQARLDVALRSLAAAVVGSGHRPLVVVHHGDGTIDVALDGPVELPAPWHRLDDRPDPDDRLQGVDRTEPGTSPPDGPARNAPSHAGWSLPASTSIETLAELAGSTGDPMPALVAVGQLTDTTAAPPDDSSHSDAPRSEVLVDPEAAGLLAIDAPAEFADRIVTAIAATLATSLSAETAHLVGVGIDDAALVEHPNAALAPDVRQAMSRAVELVGSTTTAGAGTFDLRTRRTGGEAWEPAIVLVASAAAAALSADDLPRAGRGIAVVAAAPMPRSGLRLQMLDDGWCLRAGERSWHLQPYGLDDESLRTIEEFVTAAGRLDPTGEGEGSEQGTSIAPPQADGDHQPELRDATTVHPTDDPDRLDRELHHSEPTADVVEVVVDGEDTARADHAIVVRLLGGVSIEDTAGAERTWQRSKTIELIAWLATHRHRPTRTKARHAMWVDEVRDATFANIVSEARRGLARLVPPPDGEEWIPRTLTDELALHPLVRTDAELLRDRLDAARATSPDRAIALLRPAVERIAGAPFADTDYLWPDADGLITELTLLATSACTELAGHALATGDTDLVFHATGRSLAVLPGHEESIALRMRAHARRGDLAGVRSEWESYERVLVADAWSDGEPAPDLLALRRELLNS